MVSIDTCATRRRTEAYLRAIASVTDTPVRTLVNTHHHGDHTFGNYLFRDATIVGHERTREGVLDWADRSPTPTGPTSTGATSKSRRRSSPTPRPSPSGSTTCDARSRHVGTPAHTTDDSIVWMPERELLFSGDLLFNGGTPFLLQGSIAGAIRVLEDVVGPLGARTRSCPGTARWPGRTSSTTSWATCVSSRKPPVPARPRGSRPLEAARETDLGPYAELGDPERIVGNLHRAYAELDGVPPGAQIDVFAALTDMVTYNGGRPLTCLA